jgi:gamma-glutamyltranspeptidase/glutathione hydrolase
MLIAGLAVACAPPQTEPATSGGTRVSFPFDWEFRGIEPTASGTNGAVASADRRATRVGLDVLEAGGNAYDAAVAVGFALAVVMPDAGNIGGGGFVVLRTADGETAALDFREMAPLMATPDRFLDRGGVPTDSIRIGHKAVGVPGTVAGLAELHRRYGSLPWADLLEPAIDLADNGFTVTDRLSDALTRAASKLEQFATARQIFLRGGQTPRTGSTLRQPMLATTLRMIASEGKGAFYNGRIADMIVEEMRENGGLITSQDLQRYQAKWREPITFEYRGHTVISMPPPSSGGVVLAQILNILEGYNISQLGFNTPESVHLDVESFRRAFADRNYYLGDPDFVEMPIERLTSKEYAAELRQGISRSRASSSETFNRVPVLEGSNTTHYSIVDSLGNAAAVTYTINSGFGSGVVVERGGFFLNNEMDDFTVRAGFENLYGLVQSEANLVGPGRRPLSAMTPTIVLDPEGQLLMVLGSPGGPKIITAVAQTLMNVVDFGMDARFAVDAPRIHHQLLPDILQVEDNGLDNATRAALLSMGHQLSADAGYFGAVNLIVRGANGVYYGAHDPRRDDGLALAY